MEQHKHSGGVEVPPSQIIFNTRTLIKVVCSYLVVLVHTEAAHFGLDVFADMFRGWQEATFRLKPQRTENQLSNTHTQNQLSNTPTLSRTCDFLF